MATNDVIVQVVFNSDGIDRITADFVDLDLFSVRNKPIEKWFEASGGRASWEGLIEEIQRAVQDHEARILFYYENGTEDLVSRFNDCLEKEHNVNVYVAQSDEAKARILFNNAVYHKDHEQYDRAFAQFKETFALWKLSDLSSELIQLAAYYEHRDENKAWECYRMVAELGDAEVQWKLAEHLWNEAQQRSAGEFKEDFCEEALQWALKAAENGVVQAQRFVGNWYLEHGQFQTAETWYRKANEQGDIEAGQMLEVITSEEGRSMQAELRNVLLLAMQGDADAQYELGERYLDGNGVIEDKTAAAQWFCRAASQNHAEAQFRLFQCYENGWGVEINDEKAVEWLNMAAHQNHAEAQYHLGLRFGKGLGVVKNEAEAVRWYTASAKQNYAPAQYSLGLCYQMGRGIAFNHAEAAKWFLAAAEQGLVSAQVEIADCYNTGTGVTVNQDIASQWYIKAAEKGNPKAQRKVGYFYEYGIGEIQKNVKKAFEYYQMAANQESNEAMYRLGMCYLNAIGVEKDVKKGVESITSAAESGHLPAQYELGKIYYEGKIVPQDLEKAKNWLEKSSSMGYKSSDNLLEKVLTRRRFQGKVLNLSDSSSAPVRLIDIIEAALLKVDSDIGRLKNKLFEPRNPKAMKRDWGISDADEVYLMYINNDGCGEFIITSSGILSENWYADDGLLPWNSFVDGIINLERDGEDDEAVYTIVWTDGRTNYFGYDYSIDEKEQAKKIVTFLQELKSLMKKHWGHIYEVPADQIGLNDCIMAALKRTQLDFNDVQRKNNSEKKRDELRKQLSIPLNDTVYLEHDDTILKNGKNGFALTRSGVFCKSISSHPEHTTWKELLDAETLEYTNNKACVRLVYEDSENKDKLLSYFALGAEQDKERLIQFWIELSKELKENWDHITEIPYSLRREGGDNQ